MNKDFEYIKNELAENLAMNYEDTIKAIISIEKNLDDKDMIDFVYNDYMESDHMLLNDCIDKAIYKYEQNNYKRNVNSRKTLEDVKTEINSYKSINSMRIDEGKERFNQKRER